MFRRIRETSRIIAEPLDGEVPHRFPYKLDTSKPDEDARVRATILTRLLDAIVLVAVGSLVSSLLHELRPGVSVGFVGAAIGFISWATYGIVHNGVLSLVQRLSLGTIMRPYFGRRVTHTVQILKS